MPREILLASRFWKMPRYTTSTDHDADADVVVVAAVVVKDVPFSCMRPSSLQEMDGWSDQFSAG
jgi:hypothetical protein